MQGKLERVWVILGGSRDDIRGCCLNYDVAKEVLVDMKADLEEDLTIQPLLGFIPADGTRVLLTTDDILGNLPFFELDTSTEPRARVLRRQLREQALAKLTPEERAALGVR